MISNVYEYIAIKTFDICLETSLQYLPFDFQLNKYAERERWKTKYERGDDVNIPK